MASIHKDPRGKSPYFFCAFKLPNGKRVFRSTKLTDRSAALKFCLAMETASGKVVERNLPEEQARRILNEMRILSGEEPIRFRSLESYCKEWLASKETSASAGTVTRYRGIMEGFLAHAGTQRANASIETVTASEVKTFRDLQILDGKSHTTANLTLKMLRGLFNDARREGLISVNPAEGVKTFDMEKEARDVFTHEQLRAVIAAAPQEWKTAILLGYYGGLRLTDAVGLSWENVNLEQKQVRYLPRKTSHGANPKPDWKKHIQKQLEIPLMPELEAHLLTLPSSDNPYALLCPTLAAKGTGGNRGLSSMFQRIMANADVHGDRGVAKTGKGRQFKTLGFHSLRHTFVSSLANADVPADVRRKISGHSDEKIHERYTHLDIDAKRRAMSKLPPLTS